MAVLNPRPTRVSNVARDGLPVRAAELLVSKEHDPAIGHADIVDAIKNGKVDLDDPATTLTLIKLNSVVGVQESSTPMAV